MSTEDIGKNSITVGAVHPPIIKQDPTLGRKFDSGKIQYGLTPPHAFREVVNVLTIGAKKYAPNNWKYVENARERYFDALQRHVWAWQMGEEIDDEYGTPHLAHAICCLLFLLEMDLKPMDNKINGV